MRIKFYSIFSILGIASILISCYSWTVITPTIILSTASPSQISTGTAMPTIESTTTTVPSCRVRTGIPDGKLNLRYGASDISQVITVLAEGQILYPISNVYNGWLAVTTENGEYTGYVNAKYITCQGEQK